LREFVAMLEDLDMTHAGGYLRRGDFSRWIADVFGDHALAREIQAYERKYLPARASDTVGRIVGAIRSRYELNDQEAMVS
jgi:hypothetical protein